MWSFTHFLQVEKASDCVQPVYFSGKVLVNRAFIFTIGLVNLYGYIDIFSQALNHENEIFWYQNCKCNKGGIILFFFWFFVFFSFILLWLPSPYSWTRKYCLTDYCWQLTSTFSEKWDTNLLPSATEITALVTKLCNG